MRLKTALRLIAREAGLYWPIRNWQSRRFADRDYRAWLAAGCPVPPAPKAKRELLKRYATEYGLCIFVETGTFHGDTIMAMQGLFGRLISIELSNRFHRQALDRFRGYRHVELIHGDSGRVLEQVIPSIREPALFWLDGHYSGADTARGEVDTPVLAELGHILRSSVAGHVILIDDARCFGVDPAYPTISQVEEFVRARRSGLTVSVDLDIIRIVPCCEG